jgi:2-polyprenyl-3-methyl-5-hydroxy-6-metoxy-1,4-benzoquinol methylase
MTQAYYEEYWLREEESVVADPLTPRRIGLLRAELRPDDRKILDAGRGPGTLVSELAEAGYEAIGLDIFELASRRYPAARFLQHSVEDLPWPAEPGSQDFVAAFEVIEHLLRPRALIEGAGQALAPGGHLALSYHGLLKNTAAALVAFDRHFAAEGDHIRFFSDRALRLLLTSAGFEVERIRHFGRFPGVWAGVFVWARKASG